MRNLVRLLIPALVLLLASSAAAQFIPRPAERMPEAPEPAPPPEEEPVQLPPVVPDPSTEIPALLRIVPRTIEVRGKHYRLARVEDRREGAWTVIAYVLNEADDTEVVRGFVRYEEWEPPPEPS